MEAHEYRKTVYTPEGDTLLLNRLWADDISKTKRTIKQKLIQNQDIRTLIDNPDLKDTDDYSNYLYTNIFPFLLIPATISDKRNYICFKVDFADDSYYEDMRKENYLMRVVNIQFTVLVHKDNAKTDLGVERHDALACVIRQMFSWAEKDFPSRLDPISDVEGITDNDYLTRTITFNAEYSRELTDSRRKNPYSN
jgi:hypothetical protein